MSRVRIWNLGLLMLLGSSAIASSSARRSIDEPVDLHAHLFMKQGMGWLFDGGFFGPLRARTWQDRLRSMANPDSLERSGLRIVVIALYAHPLLAWDLRESIRQQMDLAEDFVRTHPAWMIARDAEGARSAIQQGKRVLIFALEGASGVLETEEDLREFVDRRGLRIVTLLHLTDDELGGVALLRGMKAWCSPWALLKSWWAPKRTHGIRVNPSGLTSRGRTLAKNLLDRGVWLDLAHASDETFHELAALQRSVDQPLLVTHTVLRTQHLAERALSDAQLALVTQSRGIVGLMPSEDMLNGLEDFRAQRRELEARLGIGHVMLGSDWNGAIPHLRPGNATGTTLDQPAGLWNIGQSAELWHATSPTPCPSRDAANALVHAWSRVRRR